MKNIMKSIKIYTNTFAVLTVLFFCTSLLAQGTTIKGTIKNGTTGGSATLGSITITGFSSGGMDQIGALENVTGEFEFSNVAPSGGMPYLIQAEYKGVRYSSHAQVTGSEEIVNVEFTVYEAKNEESLIRVEEPYVYFRYSGSGLEVLKRLFIKNENEEPYTYVNDDGTVRFFLPPENSGINFITVNSGTIPIEQEARETEEEGIHSINYPIRPGNTEVMVSYNVPYPEKRYVFEEKMLYGSGMMYFVTQPSDIELSGEGLVSQGIDARNNLGVYVIEDLMLEAGMKVTVVGGTPFQQNPMSPNEILWRENRIAEFKWVLFLMLGLLLTAAVILSKNKASAKDEKIPVISKKLQVKKDKLLRDIADLDDRLAENTVSKDEHKRARSALMHQVVDLYKKL